MELDKEYDIDKFGPKILGENFEKSVLIRESYYT